MKRLELIIFCLILCVLTACALKSMAAAVVVQGLHPERWSFPPDVGKPVFWFKMDGTDTNEAGNLVNQGSAGTSLIATNFGAVYTSELGTNCYSYDGASHPDHAFHRSGTDFGNYVGAVSNMTITFWMKHTNMLNDGVVTFNLASQQGPATFILNTTNIIWQLNGTSQVHAPAPGNATEWIFVCGILNCDRNTGRGEFDQFVFTNDGPCVASNVYQTALDCSGFMIGLGYYYTFSYAMQGYLRDVRVFTNGITEVQRINIRKEGLVL